MLRIQAGRLAVTFGLTTSRKQERAADERVRRFPASYDREAHLAQIMGQLRTSTAPAWVPADHGSCGEGHWEGTR